MCIIIAKYKNGKLPSKEILENCFINNDDGAGFMYVDSGKVIVDKRLYEEKRLFKTF